MPEDTEVSKAAGPEVSGPEKHGRWFSRMFRRGLSQPSIVPQPESPQPTASKPVETQKSTEVIKAEIGAGLIELCQLRDKIIGKKQEIYHFQGAGEDLRKLKAEQADLEKTLQMKSIGLIGKMDEAKERLGDYCAIVHEGDNKAAILLRPLEKHRTVMVRSNDPSEKYKAPTPKPWYTKQEDYFEVFAINRNGIGKFEAVTDRTFDNIRPDIKHSLQSSLDAQAEMAKDLKSLAPGVFIYLLNGGLEPEEERYMQIYHHAKNILLGIYPPWQERNDRLGELSIEFGKDVLNGMDYTQVTFGPEVLDALNGSVEQARLKKEQGYSPQKWESQHLYLYREPYYLYK